MASITHQKADMKAKLSRIVMGRYDCADPVEQRAIARGLLFNLMGKMTLKELRGWRDGIAINEHVNAQLDAIRAKGE